MLFQTTAPEARYIAELIVSVGGAIVLFALVIWLISKNRGKPQNIASSDRGLPSRFTMETKPKVFDGSSSSTRTTQESKRVFLADAFANWQSQHLLKSDDGKSLFVRDGVEKHGLRYQLLATTQTQALAVLLFSQLTAFEPGASHKAEALLASLLAHPAYGESNLSSWKYLPDLPSSPKLDADLHAEAWAMLALLIARQQWQELDRFSYADLIPERLSALFEAWQTHEESYPLPESRFLLDFLERNDPTHDWSSLKRKATDSATSLVGKDARQLALSLLNLGLTALSSHDDYSVNLLKDNRQNIESFAFDELSAEAERELSKSGRLACVVPALMVLGDAPLLERAWQNLSTRGVDKDDGFGATMRVFALALLSNQVWVIQHFANPTANAGY